MGKSAAFTGIVTRTIPRNRFSTAATAEIVTSDKKFLKPFSDIPGPKRLPLIGHLHLFTKFGPYNFPKLYDAYQDLHAKYGDVVRLDLGISIIALFNPEDVKKLWQMENLQPRRPVFEALRHYRLTNIDRYGSAGLVAENGEKWWDLRRAINFILKPQFVYDNYYNAQCEVAGDFIKRMREIRNTQYVVEDSLSELYRYTEEAIGVVCFGTRMGLYNQGDEASRLESEQLTKAASDILQSMADTLLGFPWWKLFRTPTYRKLENAQAFLLRYASNCLKTALYRIEHGEDKEPTLQLLKILSQEKNLKDIHVRLLMTEIFSGGIDATGNAIGFLLYNMAKNPEIQERLYEEIRKNVSSVEELTPETYQNLPYMHACIRESHRLTPIGGGFARIIDQPASFGGYEVPKDVTCLGVNPVICWDERFFKDPFVFKPERWIDEKRPAHPCSMLPFGLGVRRCIGQRFAEQEIRIILIKVIQNFKLKYNGPDIHSKMRLVLTPDKPLNLQFIDRY